MVHDKNENKYKSKATMLLIAFILLIALFVWAVESQAQEQTLSQQYITECNDSVIYRATYEIKVVTFPGDTILINRRNGTFYLGDRSILIKPDSTHASRYEQLKENESILLHKVEVTFAPTFNGLAIFAIRKYYELLYNQ